MPGQRSIFSHGIAPQLPPLPSMNPTTQNIADAVAAFYHNVNRRSIGRMRYRMVGDGTKEQHGTMRNPIGGGLIISLPAGGIQAMADWYRADDLTPYDISNPAALENSLSSYLLQSEGALLAEPTTGKAYMTRVIKSPQSTNQWPETEYTSRIPNDFKVAGQQSDIKLSQLGGKSRATLEAAILIPQAEIFVVSNTAVGIHGAGGYSGFVGGNLVFNTELVGPKKDPQVLYKFYENGPKAQPRLMPYTPGMSIPYNNAQALSRAA